MISNVRGVVNLKDFTVEKPSQDNINLSLNSSQYEMGLFYSESPQSKRFFPDLYVENENIRKGVFHLDTEKSFFSESVYTTKTFDNIFDFASFVSNDITCNHYMTTGTFVNVGKYDKVIATSANDIKDKEKIVSESTGVISRTKNFIVGKNKPGIISIDIDKFEGKVLSIQETLDRLFRALPELKSAPMVIFPSTSSNLYGKINSDAKEWYNKDGVKIEPNDFGNVELNGISGFHIFVGISSTSFLHKNLFDRINQRLWLEDCGFISLASNGNMLERGLIDLSALKPYQPIFTKANVSDPKIFQNLGEPWIINPDAKPFNLLSINKLTHDEVIRYTSLVEEAKELLVDESDTIRRADAENKAKNTTIAKDALKKGSSVYKLCIKNLTEDYINTSNDRVLLGNQELYLLPIIRPETGTLLTPDVKTDKHGTSYVSRTIDQILENPDMYHGARCASIEDLYYAPGGKHSDIIDYSRARVWIKHEPFPRVHDYAHGGVSYKLLRNKVIIEYAVDNFDGIIDSMLLELKKRNCLFKRSSVAYKLLLNEKNDLTLMRIGNDNLKYIIGQNFTLFDFDKKGQKVEVWPNSKITEPLLSEFCIRNECNTKGVTTIPYIDISGKLRVKKGYDPSTGFIYDEKYMKFEELSKKREFTIEEMKLALEVVERPIKSFRFKDNISSANMLSAMFTVALKQWFNIDSTAMYPAFTTDGPGYGLGKTKLLQILGILMKGKIPGSSTLEGDSIEMKKEIGSKFIDGNDFVFFDNVSKKLQGETLSSMLTSKSMAFRVLGESKEAVFDNTSFIVASGKNINIHSELIRRFFNIRIEPVEANYLNHKFDFEPVDCALVNRYEILEALMTLYMGYKYLTGVNGLQGLQDFEKDVIILGSFETWSKNIGGCVKFIGQYVADKGNGSYCGDEIRYGTPGEDINEKFKEEAEKDMKVFYTFIELLCDYFKDDIKNNLNKKVKFKWSDIESVIVANDKDEVESDLGKWFLFNRIQNGANFSRKTKGFIGNIWSFEGLQVRFSCNKGKNKIYYLEIGSGVVNNQGLLETLENNEGL